MILLLSSLNSQQVNGWKTIRSNWIMRCGMYSQWEETKAIVLETEGKPGETMRQYYDLIMDWDRREKLGLSPLINDIEKNVKPIDYRERFISYLAKERIQMFLGVGLCIDQKDSNNYIVTILPKDLRFRTKDYVLSEEPNLCKIREISRKCTIKRLILCGYSENEAEEMEKLDFSVRKQMAPFFYSREEREDLDKTYNRMSVAEFSDKCGFDFGKFLIDYGFDKTDTICVQQPEPVFNNCRLLLSLPLETLKAMAICHLVDYASNLNREMDLIEKELIHAEYGKFKDKSDEKKAIYTVRSIFDDTFERAYIKRCFCEEYKQEMCEMVEEMRDAFSEIIREQTWMTIPTKQNALEKLKQLKVEIGYPSHFMDLFEFAVDPSLSLYDNAKKLDSCKFRYVLDHYYNQPVDKGIWFLSADSINAAFSPDKNRIIFPAGILQPPFFTADSQPAINYGAIGTVIAHEMTHGFDNHGKDYDTDGNRTCWWTIEDEREFNRLVETTRQHFDELEALPGLKCNGLLTLGENLADYGGVKIAYRALQKVMERRTDQTYKGFTWEQLFFISYAQNWGV